MTLYYISLILHHLQFCSKAGLFPTAVSSKRQITYKLQRFNFLGSALYYFKISFDSNHI